MLTIGQFSKACHVTIKTLRHYDQIGLLRPAFVDPDTGFRYYRPEQIQDVLFICRMKRYGLSLGEISALQQMDASSAARFLKEKEAALLCQLRNLQTSLQDLRMIIERAERNEMTKSLLEPSRSISLVTPEKSLVLSHRETMGVGDFGRAYSILFEQLAKDHMIPGLTGSRYWDEEFNPDASDIESFVTLPDAAASIASGSIGGTLCAHLTHLGGYSTLSDSYAELSSWILENGYLPDGAPYEIYAANGFHNPDPASWKTEIYFPVRKA